MNQLFNTETASMGIGFTGTRTGMTQAQKESIKTLLKELHHIGTYFSETTVHVHHGDCVGADLDFHTLVRDHGEFWIKGHPPSKSDLRAYSICDELAPERSYLARDKDIVNESSLLIGCPQGNTEPTEQQAGGTWYTIRYAVKKNKPVVIVWPDGRVEDR